MERPKRLSAAERLANDKAAAAAWAAANEALLDEKDSTETPVGDALDTALVKGLEGAEEAAERQQLAAQEVIGDTLWGN